jgi:hypothetical protein
VRRLPSYAAPVLVGLLALPFVLKQNSFWEWSNAYWLLERQTAHVSAHGVPTFFVHNLSGVYNPFYVYYAGFTLSVLAYPAAVVGPWPVFVVSIVGAMVCGYLGIWWAARSLGLSPQLAILPALVFATTPYVLSQMYGRGAWAELVGTNAAAVALGATATLARRPERLSWRPLAALLVAGAALAGTHNLSLLLAVLLLPLMLAAVLVARPVRRDGALLRAGVAGVGAISLGVGLTAPWLLPNLWFGPSTWVAQSHISDQELQNPQGLSQLTTLLSPLPVVPDSSPNPSVYAQAPVLAMLWVVVAFAIVFALRRPRDRSLMAGALGLAVLALGLVLLISDPSWWLSFPRLLRTVQFPYRLIPYLAMVVALAISLVLVGLHGRLRRPLTGVLIALVAVQFATGVWIVTQSKSYSLATDVVPPKRAQITASREPKSFGDPRMYAQYQFRVWGKPTIPGPNAKPARVDMAHLVTSDTGVVSGVGQVGQRSVAPIVWSHFVQVTGDARITGRYEEGVAIVTVTHTDPNGRWRAKAEAAYPWQVVFGLVISIISLIVVVLVCAVSLWRRRKRRDVKDQPRAAAVQAVQAARSAARTSAQSARLGARTRR